MYPAVALYSTPHLTAKTWEPEKQIESDFLLHCLNLIHRRCIFWSKFSILASYQQDQLVCWGWPWPWAGCTSKRIFHVWGQYWYPWYPRSLTLVIFQRMIFYTENTFWWFAAEGKILDTIRSSKWPRGKCIISSF